MFLSDESVDNVRNVVNKMTDGMSEENIHITINKKYKLVLPVFEVVS